jgi:hypothetical protein
MDDVVLVFDYFYFYYIHKMMCVGHGVERIQNTREKERRIKNDTT